MTPEPTLRVERLPGRPGEGVEATVALQVPSDLGLVDRAVELLLAQCFPAERADRRAIFRVRVAVGEALINAMECGNGCDPDKMVGIQAELYPHQIRLAVSDEGPGFDPSLVPDPRSPDILEGPCGRGLFIIRHLADQVEFNARGNTIWMTLPRR